VSQRACWLRFNEITYVGHDVIATGIRPDLANTF